MIQNKEIRFDKFKMLTKNPKFQNSIRKNPNFDENSKISKWPYLQFQRVQKSKSRFFFFYIFSLTSIPLGGLFV